MLSVISHTSVLLHTWHIQHAHNNKKFLFSDKSPADSPSPVGAIVGGVIGAIVGVAIVGVAVAIFIYYIMGARKKGSINL